MATTSSNSGNNNLQIDRKKRGNEHKSIKLIAIQK